MTQFFEMSNALGGWLITHLPKMSLELLLFALVVYASIRLLRIKSPAVRHLFWCLVLLKPVVTLLIASPLSLYSMLPPHPMPLDLPAKPLSVIEQVDIIETDSFVEKAYSVEPLSIVPRDSSMLSEITPLPAWQIINRNGIIALIWMTGSILLAFRLILGFAYVSFLRQSAELQQTGKLADALATVSKTLNTKRGVRIAVSSVAHGPVIAGIIRPVILLPRKLANALSPDQIKHIIAHELAHVRRWDNLALLFQRVAETFLFFHPVVWFCGWIMRRDAEQACDNLVLSAYEDSERYADSLTRVAEWHFGFTKRLLVNTFAAAESNLAGRIRQILSGQRAKMTLSLSLASAIALVIVGCLGLPTASVKETADIAEANQSKAEESIDIKEEVKQAVLTISTCAEADPRVKQSLLSLQGLDQNIVTKELGSFLDSEKNTIRRSAIYILWNGKFSDITPAVSTLQKLCSHEEEYTRGMAALALGANKVELSFDALSQMTADDTSAYARRCGAYALGQLGLSKAEPILEQALKDPDQNVRNNAEAALTMLEQAERSLLENPEWKQSVRIAKSHMNKFGGYYSLARVILEDPQPGETIRGDITKLKELRPDYYGGGGQLRDVQSGDFLFVQHINSARRHNGSDPLILKSSTRGTNTFWVPVPRQDELGIIGDIVVKRASSTAPPRIVSTVPTIGASDVAPAPFRNLWKEYKSLFAGSKEPVRKKAEKSRITSNLPNIDYGNIVLNEKAEKLFEKMNVDSPDIAKAVRYLLQGSAKVSSEYAYQIIPALMADRRSEARKAAIDLLECDNHVVRIFTIRLLPCAGEEAECFLQKIISQWDHLVEKEKATLSYTLSRVFHARGENPNIQEYSKNLISMMIAHKGKKVPLAGIKLAETLSLSKDNDEIVSALREQTKNDIYDRFKNVHPIRKAALEALGEVYTPPEPDKTDYSKISIARKKGLNKSKDLTVGVLTSLYTATGPCLSGSDRYGWPFQHMPINLIPKYGIRTLVYLHPVTEVESSPVIQRMNRAKIEQPVLNSANIDDLLLCDVVIMAGIHNIRPEVVDALEAFVWSGGGIVTIDGTGNVSCPSQKKFAALLDMVDLRWAWRRGDPDETYQEVKKTSITQGLDLSIPLVAAPYGGFNKNGYTFRNREYADQILLRFKKKGDAALRIGSYGKGRIAHIAWTAGYNNNAAGKREKELLNRLILWASGRKYQDVQVKPAFSKERYGSQKIEQSSAAPPRIVSTTPATGGYDVDPSISEITVTFDSDMAGGFSWTGGGEFYPKTMGKPRWVDKRTCVLPVELKEGRYYRVGINSKSHRNFKSVTGEPALPTAIYFCTRGASENDRLKTRTPTITSMVPRNGAKDIDPNLKELKVTFNIPMGHGFSWTGGGEDYPGGAGQPRWSEDGKTCTLPVALEPGRQYRLGLNSPNHNNFQSQWGASLPPVVWSFKTSSSADAQAVQSAPKAQADGLVARYSFDGNANDVSGNEYHGIVKGARLSEDRFGDVDRAYQLDGVSFISLDHEAFNGLKDFTICIWLNLDKLQFKGQRWDVNSILPVTTDAIQEELYFAQGLTSHFFGVNVKGRNHGWHRFNDCKAQPGEWVHVVLSRKEAEATLFINGKEVGAAKVERGALAARKNGVVLGQQQREVSGEMYEPSNHNLAGRIDDLCVYNRALSGKEIEEFYESSKGDGIVKKLVHENRAKDTKEAAENIKLGGKSVTFKTSEIAPKEFNAWTFFWRGPKIEEFETELQYVVLLPNGKEYFVYEDILVQEGGQIRSDFTEGMPGGDTTPFHGKHISIMFRSSKGRIRFSRSADYKFVFYNKDADGNISWRKPFAEIDAIAE